MPFETGCFAAVDTADNDDAILTVFALLGDLEKKTPISLVAVTRGSSEKLSPWRNISGILADKSQVG